MFDVEPGWSTQGDPTDPEYWPHYYTRGNHAPNWHRKGLLALAKFRQELQLGEVHSLGGPHTTASTSKLKDGNFAADTKQYHPFAQVRNGAEDASLEVILLIVRW